MIKLFTLLSVLTLGAPALATPVAYDNGLMANVPGYGWSRVETVTFCLGEVGVDRYQDLITDTEFETFGACLEDNT